MQYSVQKFLSCVDGKRGFQTKISRRVGFSVHICDAVHSKGDLARARITNFEGRPFQGCLKRAAYCTKAITC